MTHVRISPCIVIWITIWINYHSGIWGVIRNRFFQIWWCRLCWLVEIWRWLCWILKKTANSEICFPLTINLIMIMIAMRLWIPKFKSFFGWGVGSEWAFAEIWHHLRHLNKKYEKTEWLQKSKWNNPTLI